MASAEWAVCTNGVDRPSVIECWYVLIFAKKRVQCPVRHVPCHAKTVAFTPSASTNVGRRVCRAVTNASGDVPIICVTNDVVSCAIVQDVTNLATRFSNVVVGVIPTVVVVCVEKNAFVPCARKTVEMQSPKYFLAQKTKKMHCSFSSLTVNTSLPFRVLTGIYGSLSSMISSYIPL